MSHGCTAKKIAAVTAAITSLGTQGDTTASAVPDALPLGAGSPGEFQNVGKCDLSSLMVPPPLITLVAREKIDLGAIGQLLVNFNHVIDAACRALHVQEPPGSRIARQQCMHPAGITPST